MTTTPYWVEAMKPEARARYEAQVSARQTQPSTTTGGGGYVGGTSSETPPKYYDKATDSWKEMEWSGAGYGWVSPEAKQLVSSGYLFSSPAEKQQLIAMGYKDWVDTPEPKAIDPMIEHQKQIEEARARGEILFYTDEAGKVTGYESPILSKSVRFKEAMDVDEAERLIREEHLQEDIAKTRAEQLEEGYRTAVISPFLPPPLRRAETERQVLEQTTGLTFPKSEFTELIESAWQQRSGGFTPEGKQILITPDKQAPYVISVPTPEKAKDLAEAQKQAEKEYYALQGLKYVEQASPQLLLSKGFTVPLEKQIMALYGTTKGDTLAPYEALGRELEQLRIAETEGWQVKIPFLPAVTLPAGKTSVIAKQIWESPITQYLALPYATGRAITWVGKGITTLAPRVTITGLNVPKLISEPSKLLPTLKFAPAKSIDFIKLGEKAIAPIFLSYAGYEIMKAPTTEQKALTGLTLGLKGAVMYAGARDVLPPKIAPSKLRTTREQIDWSPQQQRFDTKTIALAKKYSSITGSEVYAIGRTKSGKLAILYGGTASKGVAFKKSPLAFQQVSRDIVADFWRKPMRLPKGAMYGTGYTATTPETMALKMAKAIKFKPKAFGVDYGKGALVILEPPTARVGVLGKIAGKFIAPKVKVKIIPYEMGSVAFGKPKLLGKGLTRTEMYGYAKLKLDIPSTRARTVTFYGKGLAKTQKISTIETPLGTLTKEYSKGFTQIIAIAKKKPKMSYSVFKGITDTLRVRKPIVTDTTTGIKPPTMPPTTKPIVSATTTTTTMQDVIKPLTKIKKTTGITLPKTTLKSKPTISPTALIKSIPSVKVVDTPSILVGDLSGYSLAVGTSAILRQKPDTEQEEDVDEEFKQIVAPSTAMAQIVSVKPLQKQATGLIPLTKQISKQALKTKTQTLTEITTTQITTTPIIMPPPPMIPPPSAISTPIIVPPPPIWFFSKTPLRKKRVAPKRIDFFKPSKLKRDILPMPDIISIVRTEATLWKKAKYPLPTPKVKKAFAREIEARPFAWRFPTAEILKRKKAGGLF